MAQVTLKKGKKEFDNTTIGWYEKEYNMKIEGRPDMKISTYLRRNGYPHFARFMDKLKKSINSSK